jgi:hypothetical protein
MRLSDDKINHLSHVLLQSLKDFPEIQFKEEENQVRLSIKEALLESLDLFDKMEEKVRETLISYSRKIVEGSREWDVMFSKAYEEEIKKLKAV